MGIGAKLEKLLKERNMNVNELAQNIDVAPTTIYSMIRRDSKKAEMPSIFVTQMKAFQSMSRLMMT